MNKETLEEVQKQTALKYFNEQYRGSIVDTKESLEQSIKIFHDAFKAGQQWQAERMYSEEEVRKLLMIQRGNSYVAILLKTRDEELANIANSAPEPSGKDGWVKKS